MSNNKELCFSIFHTFIRKHITNTHPALFITWTTFLNSPVTLDIYLGLKMSQLMHFLVCRFLLYWHLARSIYPSWFRICQLWVRWIWLDEYSCCKFLQVSFPVSEGTILCDTATGVPRPLVPEQHRRLVFDTLHSLSHPGVAASVKLITARLFWPNIRRVITNWARACVHCQRAKVQRYVRASLGVLSPPEKRFRRVHIDIVGPWPVSSGCSYVLNCIDRFSHWPEATPITAETIAKIFVFTRVSRFGCPERIATNRGRQFEASLFFMSYREYRVFNIFIQPVIIQLPMGWLNVFIDN